MMRPKYWLPAAAAVLVAGCAGAPHRVSSNALIGALPLAPASLNAKCGGTDRVSVTPCPIRFAQRRHGTVLALVRGPDVVQAVLFKNNCSTGAQRTCLLEQESPVEWSVKPGPNCGTANLVFYGYDGPLFIGNGYLKVVNEWCPNL